MPVSTKIFKVLHYPDDFPVETVPTVDAGATQFELKTKVLHLGVGEYTKEDVPKVMINHDRGKKFNGVGYSEENGRITDLISVAEDKEFPGFFIKEKEYVFTAYSNKEVYNHAFKRLNGYTGAEDKGKGMYLETRPLKLDLQQLRASFEGENDAPAIRGGWFKDLDITSVEVAYIGGGGVDESDEWVRYQQSGTISALRLDFPGVDVDDEPYRFMITSDAAIHSYKSLPENELLSILIPIYEYLIEFTE